MAGGGAAFMTHILLAGAGFIGTSSMARRPDGRVRGDRLLGTPSMRPGASLADSGIIRQC